MLLCEDQMISIFMFTKTPALCEEGEAIKLKICINLARAEERMDLFWFIWRHKQQKDWGQVITDILFRVEHSHWYRQINEILCSYFVSSAKHYTVIEKQIFYGQAL